MAQSKAAPLDGTTITFGGTAVAELTNVSASMERPAIDVTHLGSLSREYVAGMHTGSLDIEFNYSSADAGQAKLWDTTAGIQTAQATLNAAGGFGVVVITWNAQESNNGTWTFDAFVTNVNVGGSEGEKITGTATLQMSTDGVQALAAIVAAA